MIYTVLLVGVTAVWGWTFVVVKDAVTDYSVLGFLTIRFGIAALAVGVFAGRRLAWRTFRVGLGIGLALAAGYYLQTLGLRYTTPTNSGLITGLFVVFTPIADRLLFGVRPTRVAALSVASGVFGMALLTGSAPSSLRLGDALTLGCAAAYGVHIALLSRFAGRHDIVGLTFAQLVSCAVAFGVAWLATEPVTAPPSRAWFAILTTAILASAAGFFVQTMVQSRISAVRTAVIITTEPMFATLFGYVLAGDRLLPVQMVGALLILGALFVGEVVPLVRRHVNRIGLNGTRDVHETVRSD
jgi:drug/metabolite transporter (DMT)-like permease